MYYFKNKTKKKFSLKLIANNVTLRLEQFSCACNLRHKNITYHKNENVFVEIKCHLDATEVFIADLIACSTCSGHHYAHHQELKSIIRWLLPVVFRAVVFKLLVWYGAEGYVSGLQDAALHLQ